MDRLFKRLAFIVFPLWCGFLIPGLAGLPKIDSRDRVDLVIPSVILEGEQLTMYCQFNVDKNSSIYTVSWYKGSREIFRFQPKQYPPKKTLPFKETQLIIDENSSDMNKLVLKKVPMALRGNVSCEVTWEPSFTTIMKTGHLVVVSPPEHKPTLEVKVVGPALYGSMVRPVDTITTVSIADLLTANCTTGPAMPAPNLTLSINGVDSKFHKGVSIKSNEVWESENKTEIRSVIMSLKLDYSHFSNKKIRVKCTASLFNLYSEMSEEFIGELPRERAVTAAAGYGLLGKNGDTRSQPGKLVWSITTIGVCGNFLLKSLL